MPCEAFFAWTQPHGEMPPKDGTLVYHGCHAVAFLGAPAPRHGNPRARHRKTNTQYAVELINCANLHSMNAHIYQELQSLSIAEKRSLGEALITSAESEASAPLITEAQRLELRSRLAHHRANPNEAGLTFSQLKASLINSRPLE